MDWFLIIVVIILSILLLGVNFYLLVLYCHPDDGKFGTSLFCKILVIMGLTLSWAQVLILPLDVSNSQGYGDGGLDVKTLWFIIYISILVMVTILIPFAMFMYEDDEDASKTNRCLTAVCYSVTTFAILAAVLFITYALFNKAKIPTTIYTQTLDGNIQSSTAGFVSSAGSVTETEENVEIKVGFPVYCMAILAFVGWFLFAIFGGVGLSALPIDLIKDYYYRPKIRKPEEARQIKDDLKQETARLIELGKQIEQEQKDADVESGFFGKMKAKRTANSTLKKFKVGVFNLEKNYEIFKLELNYLDHNPLLFVGKFILGVIFSIVSFLWWLHILLFIVINKDDKPASTFLNGMLIGLDQAAGFLATTVFGFLSLYLLWCTTKGTLKLGLRIFCFTIHPMKINETWMNSFLFNIQLILLASVSVTQFCSKAFSQYARLTDIDLIFNGQIKYLTFYGWFNDNQVFEITLLAWSVIVAFYLGCTAKKQDGVIKEIQQLRKAKYKG